MGPHLESRLESPRIPHTCTCTGARAVPGEERTAPLLLEALVTVRRHAASSTEYFDAVWRLSREQEDGANSYRYMYHLCSRLCHVTANRDETDLFSRVR